MRDPLPPCDPACGPLFHVPHCPTELMDRLIRADARADEARSELIAAADLLRSAEVNAARIAAALDQLPNRPIDPNVSGLGAAFATALDVIERVRRALTGGKPYCRCCTANRIEETDLCSRCATGRCPACCINRTGPGFHKCEGCT